MHIAPALLDAILDHARRDAPNECCGFVALEDGRAVEVLPVENVAASPLRFEVGPHDLLRVTGAIEDAGRDIAIYHSHTRSAPYPSQTDINFAAQWPGVQWLIVGVAGDEPEVRNYAIDGGVVTEVEVRVDGA
jgi:[CysO sulfur-carrier protein]-S-L-cysteine hydrolase